MTQFLEGRSEILNQLYILSTNNVQGTGLGAQEIIKKIMCIFLQGLYNPHTNLFLIYLFLERGEGKEKERDRNINVRLPFMHALLRT